MTSSKNCEILSRLNSTEEINVLKFKRLALVTLLALTPATTQAKQPAPEVPSNITFEMEKMKKHQAFLQHWHKTGSACDSPDIGNISINLLYWGKSWERWSEKYSPEVSETLDLMGEITQVAFGDELLKVGCLDAAKSMYVPLAYGHNSNILSRERAQAGLDSINSQGNMRLQPAE
jgi:hypothetical protein